MAIVNNINRPNRRRAVQGLGPQSDSFPEARLEDARVDTEINRITSAGSPILTAARQRAQNFAASRGLRNSSLAAGAGEEALIKSARDIASQNAEQINQRNIARQQAQTNRRTAGESFGFTTRLNQQSIDATTARDTTAFGRSKEFQELGIEGQSRIQGEAGDIQNARDAEQFAYNQLLQAGDIEGRSRLQGESDEAFALRQETEIQAARDAADAQFGFATDLQAGEIEGRSQLQSEAAEIQTQRDEVQFAYTQLLQAGDIEGRSRIQGESDAAYSDRQEREIQAAQDEAEAQRGFEARGQEREIDARSDLQRQADEEAMERLGIQLSSQQLQQVNSDRAALERLGIQVDSQTAIAIMDANTRLQLSNDNLGAQERYQTGTLMLEADRIYTSALNAIASNPDLPANVRTSMKKNALDVLRNSQNLIQGLYNVDIVWNTDFGDSDGGGGGGDNGDSDSDSGGGGGGFGGGFGDFGGGRG